MTKKHKPSGKAGNGLRKAGTDVYSFRALCPIRARRAGSVSGALDQAEYARKACEWNPVFFDAELWAYTARKADEICLLNNATS